MSDNSFLGYSKTREENGELLKFLAEEAKKAEAPLNLMQMSKVFVEKRGSSRTAHAVYLQTRKLLLKVPKMENIDKETKVRMFIALSSPVSQEYLNELRKDAVVVVDERERITKYEANDGSLKLGANHNVGTKIRAGREVNKRRSEIARDSQETKNDVKKVKEMSTRCGRVSIKRRPASPVHIPKSTKKSKEISSERRARPQEEVVHDGPGEPSRQLQMPRKRESLGEPVMVRRDEEEQREREPEPLRLIANLAKVKLEEGVDFGVGPEDAVDNSSTIMSASSSVIFSYASTNPTSINSFLKLLRRLIGTLESPKLIELQEKIDRKIEELGDQNLKAPFKDIPLALESAVRFLAKNATSPILTEDYASIKEVFLIFKTAAFDFTAPEFGNFQKALKDANNQIGTQDKGVAFEKIHYGLDYAINFILP